MKFLLKVTLCVGVVYTMSHSKMSIEKKSNTDKQMSTKKIYETLKEEHLREFILDYLANHPVPDKLPAKQKRKLEAQRIKEAEIAWRNTRSGAVRLTANVLASWVNWKPP